MPAHMAAKEGYQQILWLPENAKPIETDAIKANGAVDMIKKSPEMKITEVGQMNFFAVIIRDDGDFNLVTPPLAGTVLPGITRDSCLELVRSHNLPSTDPSYACLPSNPAAKRIHPSERDITVEELVRLNTEGRVLETYGAGTAAVICPIGRVRYRHRAILFPEYPGGYGPVSKALVEALEGIFVGRIESP